MSQRPITRPLLLTLALPITLFYMGCSDQKLWGETTPNLPPIATIVGGVEGNEYIRGEAVIFNGSVYDEDEDDTLETLRLAWSHYDSEGELTEICGSSDVDAATLLRPDDDGFTTCSVTLPSASTSDSLRLSLRVWDDQGALGEYIADLALYPNTAPRAVITSPVPIGDYVSNGRIIFEGQVTDEEDPSEALATTWTSSVDGLFEMEDVSGPDANGDLYGTAFLSEGTHTLTLRVDDLVGAYDEDNITIDVGPPNAGPDCEIYQPADGAVGADGASVTFQARVADPESPLDLLDVSWQSDRDGALADSIPGSDGEISFTTRELSLGTHAVTLQVFDEAKATCSDTITYTVGGGPGIAITSPVEGDIYGVAESILFSADLSDVEDSDCADLYTTWTFADTEDVLWEGYAGDCDTRFDRDDLPEGAYTLTLTVVDSDDNFNTERVSFSVEDCLTDWYYDGDGDGYGDSGDAVEDCTEPAGGYVSRDGDCDDSNGDVNPGASEACNGADDNCNGDIDEGLSATSFYEDADGDGYGNPDIYVTACAAPPLHVTDYQDCDDTDANINPDTVWYQDFDGDGYGDPDISVTACVQPAGYTDNALDCNDGDDDIHPDADETCDDVDEDCDGTADNDPIDGDIYYADFDGDFYGDAENTLSACEQPTSYVFDDTDCNDSDSGVNPTAAEICDSADQDCDTLIDEGVTTGIWYLDADTDGYGDPATAIEDECVAPSSDYITTGSDCDDSDVAINPGADEVCNGVDDNCNGDIDSADAAIVSTTGVTWYQDFDGDGFGDPDNTTVSCDQPAGYVFNDEDCDDGRADINPDADEICDKVDQDCDDVIDNNPIDGATYYEDLDGDLYGDEDTLTTACAAPPGYVSAGSTLYDCNDSDGGIYPTAVEICDDIDQDCDDLIDEGALTTWHYDFDSDGYGSEDDTVDSCAAPTGYIAVGGDCVDYDANINPGITEICNWDDDDCDGAIDDEDGSLDASTGFTWYWDGDGDDYGAASGVTTMACLQPDGYSGSYDDCDDGDYTIYPGATEDCDGEDQDCDTYTDEGFDADLDGYTTCESDCNDNDASSYPGATEACDDRDNDCDTYTDEGLDGDGDGWTTCAGDCDDSDASYNPGASDTCDGANQDCDGAVDEDAAFQTWYADDDSDDYGVSTDLVYACSQPSGYSGTSGDCDDGDSSIKPGATESCDDVDEDCDNLVDEGAGCTVATVSWYDDDCNTGCPTNCSVGSGSGALDSIEAAEGACYNLASPDAAAQVDIVPDATSCPAGMTLLVTIYKGADCTGTDTSLEVTCSGSGTGWNLNCEDSNGDGYGDFDDHVDSFRIVLF